MIELYKSIGDDSSARGVILEFKNEINNNIFKAIRFENLGDWKEARKIYQQLQKEETDEDLQKLWMSQCLNSMENLSEWNEIVKTVEEKVPTSNLFDFGWNQSTLLPKYIRAAFHVEAEENDRHTIGKNKARKFTVGQKN